MADYTDPYYDYSDSISESSNSDYHFNLSLLDNYQDNNDYSSQSSSSIFFDVFPMKTFFDFDRFQGFQNFDILRERLQELTDRDNALRRLITTSQDLIPHQSPFSGEDEDDFAEGIAYDTEANLINMLEIIRGKDPNQNQGVSVFRLSWNANDDNMGNIAFEFGSPEPKTVDPWLMVKGGDFILNEQKYPAEADISPDDVLEEFRQKLQNKNINEFSDRYENGRIRESYDSNSDFESDLMLVHFPLHYILVCLGFTLLIGLLFISVTRRRQILMARRSTQHVTRPIEPHNTDDITIVIDGKPGLEKGQSDNPPTYTEAVANAPLHEDDQMLPKYKEIN